MSTAGTPPLFLRLAVVVGLTTLAIGLVGAIVIVFKRPVAVAVDAPPAPLPPAVAEGWEASEEWSVVARWEGDEGVQEVEGTTAGGSSGWAFPGAPAGVPLSILVRRRAPDGTWDDVTQLRRTLPTPDARIRLE
ncbi:MAG: hypothetical protein AB7T63_14235 [Planctomycetota bacterium]